MLTLIVTGFVLLKMGLSGGNGMFVTMMVGGVVCTALAASGALSSDLKVGYWIGATPSRQLALKFAGTAVAAIFCGIMMWVMAQADPGQGFGTAAIPAPQASAMKEILVGIFGASTSALQWYLFGVGVLFTLMMQPKGVVEDLANLGRFVGSKFARNGHPIEPEECVGRLATDDTGVVGDLVVVDIVDIDRL